MNCRMQIRLFMKMGFLVFIGLFIGISIGIFRGVPPSFPQLFESSFAAEVSKITSIQFKGTSDPAEIVIQANGPFTFEKTENVQDKQLVLELKGVKIGKSEAQKIDTSAFDSQVSLISPYQVKDQKDTVRVVVQLREQVDLEVTQNDQNKKKKNLLTIKVPKHPAEARAVASTSASSGSTLDPVPGIASDSAASGDSSAKADSASLSDSELGSASNSTSESGVKAPEITAEVAPEISPEISSKDSSAQSDEKASLKGGTNLDVYMATKDTKQFVGKHITLQIRDGEVADVLRLISEASGFNIVLGEGVRGRLNLSLVDVPWDQALDIVMKTLRLGAERNNNVLRVETLTNLATEKQQELAEKKAAEAVAPRVTRIFPINYAEPKDLQMTLEKFISQASSSSSSSSSGSQSYSTSGSMYGGSSGSGSMGSDTLIQIDNRTNNMIVRDTPENLSKMQKLIELLDIPSPQVLIEAKIIEASDSFSKNISGHLGIGDGGAGAGFASFAGGNPYDALLGSPGVFADGAAIATSSAGSAGSGSLGTIGYSPHLSFLPNIGRINAVLNWGENENQVKVVASPKTVVLNKVSASIVQGTPVLIPGTTVSQTGSPVPLTTVQQANISLKVMPTVTNDGNVRLELTVTKDVPDANGIGNRNLTTTVMVETGTTLVIGGIYNLQTTHTETGVPYLRKLPLIGALFGSEGDSTNRSELFIFVTPKILNTKEIDRTDQVAANGMGT